MKVKQLYWGIVIALLTAITLAGSIALIFEVIPRMPGLASAHVPITLKFIAGIAVFFSLPLAGGALWGAGTAALMKRNVKSPTVFGALSWGSSVAVLGILLYFSQIPAAALNPSLEWIPNSTHMIFTTIFVPAVALAASFNTWMMSGKLGFNDDKGMIGKKAGIAAGLVFLIVSMSLLFILDWEIAGPFAGRRYSMIKIMLVCNTGAALAGGMVMGWMLASQQKGGFRLAYFTLLDDQPLT
jgi:hypothetical protein